DGLLRLGGLWRSLGQPVRAREAWEAAAARQPGEPALLARLAAACLAAGDTQSAADYYKLLAKNGEPTARLEGLERLAELHA
ncbi:MAG: hypothetical protein N2322_05695, partial [Terrimicrobiaceae bacterium]|nr:hypothetical protein [Terrimicrobiaceae bacterium]